MTPLSYVNGRKKVKEQRENVLTELLVTEREYCRDLRLTYQIFQLDDVESLERQGIDASILFGNIQEVLNESFSYVGIDNNLWHV